jgi:hypothetical protein
MREITIDPKHPMPITTLARIVRGESGDVIVHVENSECGLTLILCGGITRRTDANELLNAVCEIMQTNEESER